MHQWQRKMQSLSSHAVKYTHTCTLHFLLITCVRVYKFMLSLHIGSLKFCQLSQKSSHSIHLVMVLEGPLSDLLYLVLTFIYPLISSASGIRHMPCYFLTGLLLAL